MATMQRKNITVIYRHVEDITHIQVTCGSLPQLVTFPGLTVNGNHAEEEHYSDIPSRGRHNPYTGDMREPAPTSYVPGLTVNGNHAEKNITVIYRHVEDITHIQVTCGSLPQLVTFPGLTVNGNHAEEEHYSDIPSRGRHNPYTGDMREPAPTSYVPGPNGQ
ncbi:hypothetical protein J6590_052000 [Homalodisca vitripennis]|nr:hypothetical protein J6590_052000 [Homalodisca vitripennis]